MSWRISPWRISPGLIFALAACGRVPLLSTVSVADAGLGLDAAPVVDLATPPDLTPPVPYPAPHQPFPEVENSGGEVLKYPKVVVITYDSDPLRKEMEDFSSKIGATSYWKTITAEYGVGELTMSGTVHLAAAAPEMTTSSDIETWLVENLDGPDGPKEGWPKIEEETIYAVFYPAETTIEDRTGTSCRDYGGYHSEIQTTKGSVPYAVLPRCEGHGWGPGYSATTSSASHEYIEAVTDPFPFTNPAYQQIDQNHYLWTVFTGGGEVGDMCTQQPGARYRPADFPYTVQRSWSNEAAKAGRDPCVPAEGDLYFNATVVTEDVRLAGHKTKGLLVPVGKSKTYAVELFSTGPLDPWSISISSWGGSGVSAELDRDMGQNGDKLTLTVSSSSRVQGGVAALYLVSSATVGSDRVEHYWPILVVQ